MGEAAGHCRPTIPALAEPPEVHALIQAELDKANAKYAQVEQVKKFTSSTTTSAQETGELTPTLKVKRNVVNEKYAERFDALYGGHGLTGAAAESWASPPRVCSVDGRDRVVGPEQVVRVDQRLDRPQAAVGPPEYARRVSTARSVKFRSRRPASHSQTAPPIDVEVRLDRGRRLGVRRHADGEEREVALERREGAMAVGRAAERAAEVAQLDRAAAASPARAGGLDERVDGLGGQRRAARRRRRRAPACGGSMCSCEQAAAGVTSRRCPCSGPSARSGASSSAPSASSPR